MKAALELPQGWMGKACRKWLRKAVATVPRSGIAVEVGSWRGRSTLVIESRLRSRARLYAVDTWAGVPDDPEQHDRLYLDAGDVYADFCRNLAAQIERGRVVPLRMDSRAGAEVIIERQGPGSVDFVFIDADHRYEAVLGDILAYLPLVKSGGIISGHDYNPETWPGVVRAVNETVPGYRVTKKSSIWWVRVA